MNDLDWKLNLEEIDYLYSALGELSLDQKLFPFWEKLENQIKNFYPTFPTTIPPNIDLKSDINWSFSLDEINNVFNVCIKLPTKTKVYKALVKLEPQIIKYSTQPKVEEPVKVASIPKVKKQRKKRGPNKKAKGTPILEEVPIDTPILEEIYS